MAKDTEQQRQTVRDLEASGAYSKAEAQRRQEEIDRQELANRSKNEPTGR